MRSAIATACSRLGIGQQTGKLFPTKAGDQITWPNRGLELTGDTFAGQRLRPGGRNDRLKSLNSSISSSTRLTGLCCRSACARTSMAASSKTPSVGHASQRILVGQLGQAQIGRPLEFGRSSGDGVFKYLLALAQLPVVEGKMHPAAG